MVESARSSQSGPQTPETPSRRHFLTFGRVAAGISFLSLLSLAYLAGATVMFFGLPTADLLGKAFHGAAAWQQRQRQNKPKPAPPPGELHDYVRVDQANKTYDGFTLVTTTWGCEAWLIDMQGNVVHQWRMPFSQVWPHAPHLRDQLSDDRIHWFRAYLFPNGDLLAIYHALGDTPYGYGLVKLNKDSQILWSYAECVHHDLDVAEDGTIYTLTHQLISKKPEGLSFIPDSYIADFLVTLSPEGKEIERLPLVESLRDSPYAPMLVLKSMARERMARILLPQPGAANDDIRDPRDDQQQRDGDVLHANSVKVLNREMAPKFPLFKPGQVLISLRNLSALAVVDLHAHSIAWAACGAWRMQHDAEFLDNGHLLLFDNAASIKGQRVLEYDPTTQAMPWVYAVEGSIPLSGTWRGMKQRLPNGNTLVMDPETGRLLEVAPDKELVWECYCSTTPLTGVRRYGAHELSFLKGDIHVRP